MTTEKNDNGGTVEVVFKKSKPFSLDQNITFSNGGRKIMDELNNIESFSKNLQEDILNEVSKKENVIDLFNKNEKK